MIHTFEFSVSNRLRGEGRKKIAFKKPFIQGKSLGIMYRIIFFRVTLIFYNIMVLPSSGLMVLNKL